MSKKIMIENINTPNALGVALRRMRKNAGVSQEQLAKLMDMRQGTVSDLENGRGSLESLFKIIQALRINLGVANSPFCERSSGDSKTKSLLKLLSDQKKEKR